MASKTLNLSLPIKLLKLLDRHAEMEFCSRSEYIKRAVVNQLRNEQALKSVFDKANKKGKSFGFKSEDQVYKVIDS